MAQVVKGGGGAYPKESEIPRPARITYPPPPDNVLEGSRQVR